MARNISIKVSYGHTRPLRSIKEVKDHIKKARLVLINDVKSDFNEWNMLHAEVETAAEGEEEALFLYGSVDFEGEEALSKEIMNLCDKLEERIREYDALMKFEIAKAPEAADANV